MLMFNKKIGSVFLKENSDAVQFIEKLKSLSDSADGALQKEIEKQIKIATYGVMGENAISFELKNSGMDMYILHDIYLESGEQSAQIDYMVFTRKRIYVIECKNLIGNIEIDHNGNFIRQYELFGKKIREGIYSPVTQNERHLQVIKQIRSEAKGNFITKAIFESNFDKNYVSLVVLANPKTLLNDRYAKKEIKQQVYRADQLVRIIKTLDEEVSDFIYNNKELKEIAEFYLNASKPNKSDYIAKYEELAKKCETQKDEPNKLIGETESEEIADRNCPRCGAKLVMRIAKRGAHAGNHFWGCTAFPKCRYMEQITEEEGTTVQ